MDDFQEDGISAPPGRLTSIDPGDEVQDVDWLLLLRAAGSRKGRAQRPPTARPFQLAAHRPGRRPRPTADGAANFFQRAARHLHPTGRRSQPTVDGVARPLRRAARSFQLAARLALGVGAAIPVVFLGLFFVWPVVAMLTRGFAPTGRLDLSGFAEVFSRQRTWRIIGQTLAQSLTATAIALVLAIPGAHILYRRRLPGQRVWRVLATMPFVLPTVVVGIAFRTLLASSGPLGGLGLDGSFSAIVAALVFFNYGLLVRIIGTFWATLDPRPTQAARALGASAARAWWTVTLPALLPAIASGAALVMLFCATAFGTVLILGGMRYGTIETEIWIQTTQMLDLRTAGILSIVQLAVVGLALAGTAAARRRGEQALAWRPPPPRLAPCRRADSPALVVAGLTLVGIAAPIVSLILRSLRTRAGWGLGNYLRLAAPGAEVGLPGSLLTAAVRSLRTAAQACALALVIGILIAIVLSRRPRSPAGRRALGLADAAFMLPLGVSAVTVGFGFLISLDRPPLDLRTSPVLIPIAQAVVAIPLVVRATLPALRAIDPRLRQAAAVLGASRGRVFTTIDLPVVARSLALGAGYALAVALGEFGATSFLARPETMTLPVALYRLLGRPGIENFGTALAGAVMLAAMTATIMAAAERFRLPGAGQL